MNYKRGQYDRFLLTFSNLRFYILIPAFDKEQFAKKIKSLTLILKFLFSPICKTNYKRGQFDRFPLTFSNLRLYILIPVFDEENFAKKIKSITSIIKFFIC